MLDILELLFELLFYTDGWGVIILFFLVFLLVSPIRLSGKVKRLESRIETLETRLGNAGVVRSASMSVMNQPTDIASSPVDLSPIPLESLSHAANVTGGQTNPSTSESAFTAWLKEDTLVKVGALLLILAVAWFVSYAFANNWIGPVGRITLGLIFGASLFVLGVKRMAVSVSQGSIFTVLGATTAILTISAGQYLYAIFPPLFALSLIFLVSLFVAFVSLQFERSQLAYASLFAALIAPFLVDIRYPDPFLLMVYLLLVVAGTLWVVWRLRVEKITLVALVGVILYTATAYALDTGVALLFSFIFTGIFFITNIISLIRRYTEWVSPVHVSTALLTGLYLISSILGAAPAEWQSTYLLFWALVFAYGSQQVFIRTLNRIPFYIYATVSVLLLGIATVIELSGALLTIILTLEVLALIIIMSVVQKQASVLNFATALLIIPGLFSLSHIDTTTWRTGFLHADFFALLVFLGTLVLAGLARGQSPALVGKVEGLLESGQKVLYSVAAMYGGLLIWLVTHSVLADMLATILSLVIYSLVGLALYITGIAQGEKGIKLAGQVILALVVLRLLLVETWELETAGRIVLFVIIGLLFISTAFLPKLRADKSQPN